MSDKNKKTKEEMYKTFLDRLPGGAKGTFKDMALQAFLASGETSQIWVATALDTCSYDARIKWLADGIADHRSGGITEQECEVIVNDIFRIKVEFEYEPPDTKNGAPESYDISCVRLCINNDPFEVLSDTLTEFISTDYNSLIIEAMAAKIKSLDNIAASAVALDPKVWDGEGRYDG